MASDGEELGLEDNY